MEAFLLRHGYPLLFAGVLVEGDAFLLAASLLAREGRLFLPAVILTAIAANTVADSAYFAIGRFRGQPWLERAFGQNPAFGRLQERMRTRGMWLLVASRWLFGFRILIPMACGASGMATAPFLLANVAAGSIWAIPTALVAYYAASTLEKLLGGVRSFEHVIAAVLFAFGLLLAGSALLRGMRGRPALRRADIHALAPVAIGLMGILNVASAFLPHRSPFFYTVERWFPLEVLQRSRPPMLFAGVALLQVTRSLSRRKALAWWVATFALGVAFVSHLGHLDLQHSLVAALLLVYLIRFRRRFSADSDPGLLRRGLAMMPALALLIVFYSAFGLTRLHHTFAWPSGVSTLSESVRTGLFMLEPRIEPQSPVAAHFLGSVQIAGWLARLYVLVLLLSPVIARRRHDVSDATLAQMFNAYGRDSLSPFAVQNSKHHALLDGGNALVGYAVRTSVAVTCGDPLTPAASGFLERTVREFQALCEKNGWTPCFYEVVEGNVPTYERAGLRTLKIAEEAFVDLQTFSLAGGKRATLRAQVNKTTRLGLTVEPYDRSRGVDTAIDEELESISEEWLAEKRLGEMSFTVGRFSLDALAAAPVFICRSAARVEAFCSWLPYAGGRHVVLDLMRKRSDAPSGVMDLLIAKSLLLLHERGFTGASLANAPLANVGEPQRPLEKGVALLFEKLNGFYGYKNLFQFKKKFAPEWHGRFIAYPRGADLPRIAYALAVVHGSGGLADVLFRRG